jgi:hypothetical protein
LPRLLVGLRLQLGGHGFDLFLDPLIEFVFPRLELLFPFGQCSLLPDRFGLELPFSPLGDLVIDRLADRNDLTTAGTRDPVQHHFGLWHSHSPWTAGITESMH